MITLKEVKEKYAKDKGYPSWLCLELDFRFQAAFFQEHNDNVTEMYSELKIIETLGQTKSQIE